MGEQWPDKRLTPRESYDEMKDSSYARDDMARRYFDDDEDAKKGLLVGWPFET